MTDSPLPEHVRPDGVTDAIVEALGKLSEALEAVEVCRGHLYAFHRRSGTADLTLGEAVDLLRKAGHEELADRIDTELVGRNVIHGRWTFQIVEEYDETYYEKFKALEQRARRIGYHKMVLAAFPTNAPGMLDMPPSTTMVRIRIDSRARKLS